MNSLAPNDVEALLEVSSQDFPPNTLYQGDCGTWPVEARQVLCVLLRGPSLDERKHPNMWKTLQGPWQREIRVALSHMFLELVLDEDSGVAYVQQADTEDVESSKLLREKRLTFIESLVLLYLRQCMTEADNKGERAVVTESDIIEQMTVFAKRSSSDTAGFSNRVTAAIEKLKDSRFINRIKDSDRYEVSPTLKLLLSVERVKELTNLYNSLGPNGMKQAAANDEAVITIIQEDEAQ